MITIRRVYDPQDASEKYRVLVDRLWPRGISKDRADWDEWIKEVAPSNELRKWYNHDPAKWEKFKESFWQELAGKKAELERLKQLEIKYGTITLLYASKEEKLNNAAALSEFLMQAMD